MNHLKIMKTPYKNIYEVLKLNRFIVLATVIGAVVTSTVSVLFVVTLHQETMNTAFMVNTEGDVIPLKLVEQHENLQVEVLSHLEQFHTYFYHLDASNYEKNLEKALWLGDSTVDELYQQKSADGVYNRLLQYSLVEKVVQIDSKATVQEEPYPLEPTLIFEIDRGAVTDTYELVTTGQLVRVDRNFPHNPHGLLVTNYFEKSLRKLENEN